MLLIIYIHIISFIMAKATIKHIKCLPISDHTKEMVSFIGSNQKLARTLGQINFLIDCRSRNILPSFILNKTAQLDKVNKKQKIATQISRLQKTLLNEEIKDAFRKKAFLQRSLTRHAQVLETHGNWLWLQNQGKQVFLEELEVVKRRLTKKLTKLHENQSHPGFNIQASKTCNMVQGAMTPDTEEADDQPTHKLFAADNSYPAANNHRTWRNKLLSLCRSLWAMLGCIFGLPTSFPTEQPGKFLAAEPPNDKRPATEEVQKHEEPTETNTEPRFVNLSNRTVSKNLGKILEKGPKYALTQKVTSRVLKTVEAGIERAFYGLKWQHVIDKMKKTATTSHAIQSEPDDRPSPSTTQDTDTSAQPVCGMPRPFFPDSGACQPPVIPKEGEQNLEKIKSKIISLYRGTRKDEPLNYTTAQKKELRTLQEDKTTIIKRSDKCKNLVIMDKTEYISKAESIVDTYVNVKKNPTVKLEEETKTLMKATLKDKIPDDYLRKILPQHARTAEFYGLPKTHKPGNPLRPIVSACGDPLDKLSWFLQCILTQLLSFIPAHVENTQSYLTRLKDSFPKGFPAHSIVFSIDVRNLYGSIPIHEGIQSVMGLIESNRNKINTFNLTLNDIRSLLTHVLTNNFLRFNSQLFKQTDGIAMGNRLAPPVAIAFMHAFETSFLSSLLDVPMFYVRYIDDILGVWTHGLDRLNHFFNLMNSHNTAIRLTMEHTGSTGKLAFLDTLITVHPSGTYTTELYFKPMTAPIILHYTSAHPMSTKRAVLNSEVQRAIRVSSDGHTTERSLKAISHLFTQNGYPADIIKCAIKNNKHKALHVKNRKSRKGTHKNTSHIYMRLPYINETIVRRVNGILRGSKAPIKPVWINDNSIQKTLISSALVSPPCPSGNKRCHTCENGLPDKCNSKNVVYRITCKLCETNQRIECYVGECTRPVRYRFNEHLSDARLRKLDTPLGEHIVHHHLHMSNDAINNLFYIEILDRGKDCAEVKIRESIHIRDLKPTLNSMQSSWPLTR